MIMFGSFLPSLLVGFSTTNFTREWEPTLSWNQFHSSRAMSVNCLQQLASDIGTKAVIVADLLTA